MRDQLSSKKFVGEEGQLTRSGSGGYFSMDSPPFKPSLADHLSLERERELKAI